MSTAALDTVRRLAFIGGGNMAAGLIGGLIRAGFPGDRITVADPSEAARQGLAQRYGVTPAADNAAAAAGADLVVLAVKPQGLREVAQSLSAALAATRPTVVSIAAGIPHDALSRWLGPGVPVIRTMPNGPALNGCGATALFAPPGVEPARRAVAQALMDAVGLSVWVAEESQIDTVTALSGSGPAYFFLFMEALEQAAISRGLPADIARQLTHATAHGAAVMARDAAEPLSMLRERVTSKGGTTAAALAVFEQHDLRAIVAAAVTAADRRAAELAAQFAAS